MHIKRLVAFASLFTLVTLFIPAGALALTPRVAITSGSSNLVAGSSDTAQVTLEEPIICEDPNAICNVVLNLSASDPSRVSISPSTITIPAADWYQVQYVTISAIDSPTFNNGETVTISSAPVVSAAEYYSGFQPPSMSVSLPPAAAPTLVDQTESVVSNGDSVVTNVLDGASSYPDPSTVTIVSGPAHGTVVDPEGTITYTADTGYSGTDSLTYQVCSSLEASVCSTGTLTFNVSAPSASTPDTGYGSYEPRPTTLGVSVGVFSLLIVAVGLRRLARNRT